MNPIKVIAFRIYQATFHLFASLVKYPESKPLVGVEGIVDALKKEGVNHLFLISGNTTSKKPFAVKLFETLKEEGIDCPLYLRDKTDPSIDLINSMKEAYLSSNCEAILSLGGGSSIDSGKALAAAIANPKKDLRKMAGLLKVKGILPPHIVLPTTAGSGSEGSVSAVVTDEATHHKFAISSPKLIPAYVCFEPSLLCGAPSKLIAETGMDALTHALEAYLNHFSSRIEARAIQAIQAIFFHLKKLYDDPTNEEEASAMLEASFKAGLCFSKNYVGDVHALSHALGGKYHLPHGYLNAVLLPKVLKGYGKSISKKLSILNKALRIKEEGDPINTFLSFLGQYQASLNIPTKLEIALSEEDIRLLARHAYKESIPNYPLPKLLTKKELAKILKEVSV